MSEPLQDEAGEGVAPLDQLAAELPPAADAGAPAADAGAPAGADQMPARVAPGETAALLAPLVDVLCNSIPRLSGITAANRATLAGAYADVLDKYFPGGVASWGPEVGALLVTAAIIGPCYLRPPIEGKAEPPAPAVDPPPDAIVNTNAPPEPAPPAL